ncbi:uncharacterized protein LOC131657233 [Vicia villosa]|uniref:uncharacterized protein LOC131657233 n=1 Tax=Vicia villosa TaxID=3911 RepID=UPI00273C9856|nr:uncharacterized protein LOC131657233 [Vicia villosa]
MIYKWGMHAGTYYEGGEKFKVVKLQTLRRKYELLSKGKDEKVAEYMSKVQKRVHLMKGYGETLTDKMIVEKVMYTLTSHFDHVIVAIQEFNQLETLKLEDLVGSLEAHVIRIVERKGVQDSIQALQAQLWKKNGGSNKFKGKFDKNQGKNPWSNPHKQHVEDKTFEPSKEEGENYRKDKEDKKRKYNGSTKGKDEGANLALQDSDDSEGGMVVMAAITDNHVESKIWFVEVEGFSNIPDRVEVEEGVAATSQRPQRTRILPSILKDYEVAGDDEVTPDGELFHFALLAGDESINYS